MFDGATLHQFSTMFLSVLIGVFPFLLVAVLAAGLIEVFVSRELLARIIPKNPIVGILLAPLFGFAIPLCECAIIPIAARLMRKGVPVGVAVAFMLSNPILNPFPLFATLLAFPYRPDLAVMRMVAAYGLAVVIGLIVMVVYRRDPTLVSSRMTLSGGALGRVMDRGPAATASSLSAAPAAGLPRSRPLTLDELTAPVPFRRKLLEALYHTGNEFYNVGKFFIVGAFFAAAVNVFVPRSALVSLGSSDLASVPVMMGFAFLLAICSEADAFVAASFVTTFSSGSLLAFMLYGPMVDVKNTLMMFATFKRSLVFLLIGLITAGVFLVGYLANLQYAYYLF